MKMNKGIISIEEWIGDYILNSKKEKVVKLDCEKQLDSSEEEE